MISRRIRREKEKRVKIFACFFVVVVVLRFVS